MKDPCQMMQFRRYLCRLHHRKKKSRISSFTPWQLARLEAKFAQSRYPDIFQREELGWELNIPESRIHEWFIERRMNLRRQDLGAESSSSAECACGMGAR
ncbi:unnamed protein product [Adineta steineri]|nr:unnamed protein product [Adineta steineri]